MPDWKTTAAISVPGALVFIAILACNTPGPAPAATPSPRAAIARPLGANDVQFGAWGDVSLARKGYVPATRTEYSVMWVKKAPVRYDLRRVRDFPAAQRLAARGYHLDAADYGNDMYYLSRPLEPGEEAPKDE